MLGWHLSKIWPEIGILINLTASQFNMCPYKEGDKWKRRVMVINVCLNKQCLHKHS